MSSFLKPEAHGRELAAGLLCTAMLVLVLPGCRKQEPEPIVEKSRNVRVLELLPDTLTEYFEITGPLAPVQGTDISAQETGPVVAILAEKGQNVAAGQELLELDRKILKAEMEAAAAALATQAYNLDKVQKLFDAGKVSRIELLNAEAQHESARARADISAERYRRAMIRAPFAGVVADRYVELGQMALPGQPVVRCIDPYTLKLEGYLTGNQVGWVSVGTPARVLLGDEGLAGEGTITWVGPEADRKTGKFKVEVEIPNEDLRFHSGVIGRARIAKSVTRDVVTIPRDAIMAGRHGPEVFVVEGERAHRMPVTLGPDQGAMVIVTEGLTAGQLLVVRGHRELVEGSLVKITERASAPDGSMDTDPPSVRPAGSGAER